MKSLWQTELLRYALSQHPDNHKWPQQHPDLIEKAAQHAASEDQQLQWLTTRLPAAATLQTGIQRYLQTLKTVRRLLLLVAFMLGISSSFSLLTSVQSQVNLLHVTAVCALTPLLALFLWLVSWLLNSYQPATRHSHSGIVGRAFSTMPQTLSRLLNAHHSDPRTQTAITRGWQRLMADSKLSFWSLSTLTHTAWLSFSLGALLGAFLRLSLFQYDFYWGSTILPEAWLSHFLQLFFTLPGVITEVISGSQLLNSLQLHTANQTERQLWGWLVLVSIGLYGILPRVILGLLAVQRRAHALKRLPSAFTQPFYRQLIQHMQPMASTHNTEADSRYPASMTELKGSDNDTATSAHIAFELDGAPPQNLSSLDLGHIRSSDDYQRALTRLAAVALPVSIIAWCSLARSPDTTVLNRLAAIQQNSQSTIEVRLTESDIARDRGIDIIAREQDWRDRLQSVGISRISSGEEM